MNDADEVLPKLHALKEIGLRLAIDDFGTGYSSLAYLRRFPVDILKIDKTFIDAAASGAPGGAELVRTIVDLSRSLQLTTIAEGVEDETILPELIKIGCHSVQGFHFARPMPAHDLTATLQRRNHLGNSTEEQSEPTDPECLTNTEDAEKAILKPAPPAHQA
jgi:EAL domain-containing protein (putative c-di-GMP-specific phosphodiesterase class I)